VIDDRTRADEGTAYCRWCEDVGRLKAGRRALVEKAVLAGMCERPRTLPEQSAAAVRVAARILAEFDAKGAPSAEHEGDG
jgi:hypothetical protein